MTTTYEYYNNDLLKRLKDATTSATLFDRQYNYNSSNQISQITDLTQTRMFGYDNVDRLQSANSTLSGANETYAFDDVGNRTSSHLSATYGYQSGKFNQMASTATATMNYDANGNTIQKSEGSNFWRYTWDYENRLVKASTRKQNVRYKYDALGRRVERNFDYGKERTKFTHDGLDVMVDDDFGTLTKYLNGPGIDNKLRMQTGNTVSYFLTDHLGSTNGLADSTGAITSSTNYDSFGNQTSTLATRYGFTGRERDDFTGQMYYRARFYDAKPGRFTSEDPIGFAGADYNLYNYVKNNPLNRKDPSGNISLPFLGLPNLFPSSKKKGCDEEQKSCERDLEKMKATFSATVSDMTANGQRHPFYPYNGLQGTAALLTGRTPYMSCFDQASLTRNALSAGSYENPWNFNFEQSTIPFTDWHPHTWIRAVSGNPKCKSLRLDPWKGTVGDSAFLL
ncbi:MAG: RHS repeat-associated core domain-containing protein [Acidobacteria bacterium]|nr:RHS repeat-associated core domain-containing protein [Acidobacteriota bacterium]